MKFNQVNKICVITQITQHYVIEDALRVTEQKSRNLLDGPRTTQIGKDRREQGVAELLIWEGYELEVLVPFWEQLARAGDREREGGHQRVHEGFVLAQALYNKIKICFSLFSNFSRPR